MKIFSKKFMFFGGLFLINIPFLIAYSQSFITTLVKFTTDELVYLENIDIMLSQLFSGHVLGFAYNLYSFAYGSVYWGITALVATPFWFIGSEQAMVIALRLLSLILSLSSYFMVFLILKDGASESIFTYLSILICFLNPLIVDYSNMIHPEMIYVFFLVLALYFLHKDRNVFGKYYYFAIVAFAFAVDAKLVALFFGLSFLIYLGFNLNKATPWLLVKSFLVGALAIAIPNFFLVYPLIFSRYFRWLNAASSTVSNGLPDSPSKSILFNLCSFSNRYCNIFLFCLLVFAGVAACLFFRKKIKNSVTGFYIPFVLVIFYFVFSVFYCHVPSHYGIVLMFFLPFLVLKFLQISDYSIVVLVLIAALSSKNIYGSIMRLVKPYNFSQIDFDPSKSKKEMLRIAKLHVEVYPKCNPVDASISSDALRFAYDK